MSAIKTTGCTNDRDCVQSFMESGKLGITPDDTNVCPKHSVKIFGEQRNGCRYGAWESSLFQPYKVSNDMDR